MKIKDEKITEYTSIDQLPLVLSVEQLAAVLGIGINSAYQLVRSGQVGSIRIGRQYKIPKSALEIYLKTYLAA